MTFQLAYLLQFTKKASQMAANGAGSTQCEQDRAAPPLGGRACEHCVRASRSSATFAKLHFTKRSV